MDKFDLLYGSIKADIDEKLTYKQARKASFNIIYKKNSCRFLYNSIKNIFDELYAEKIIKLVKEDKIAITDVSKLPYKNYICGNGYVNSYKVAKEGYLIPPTALRTGINNILSELGSYTSHLYRDGYEEIVLSDLCMVLHLYLIKFQSSVNEKTVSTRVNREFEDTFCTMLKCFLSNLSIKLSECKSQTTSIHLMDKTHFDTFKGNYNLDVILESKQTTLYADYKAYTDMQTILVKLLEKVAWNKSTPPNLKVFLAVTYDKKEKFLNKIADEIGYNNEGVRRFFKGIKLDNINNKYVQEAIADCLKITTEKVQSTPINKEKLMKDLENILLEEKNNITIVDEELYNKVNNSRLKNVEYIYYDKDEVESISKDILSETTIDIKEISKNKEDLNLFKIKLAEYYIDAQTVNQMKRTLFDKEYEKYYLNVKVLNVEEDMFEIVKEVLDFETKYLCNTYTDYFKYEMYMR